MDLYLRYFELEMKPMICAIMDRRQRCVDSLLVKEKYTQANYWSTCMLQNRDFGET